LSPALGIDARDVSPSSVITYQVARAWDRFSAAPLRIAIERGLAPGERG